VASKKSKKIKKSKKVVKSPRKPASAPLENAKGPAKKTRTTIAISVGTREKLRKMQDTLSRKAGERVSVDATIWSLIKIATSRKARKAK
jgi:hypothetical protein